MSHWHGRGCGKRITCGLKMRVGMQGGLLRRLAARGFGREDHKVGDEWSRWGDRSIYFMSAAYEALYQRPRGMVRA